MPTLPPGHFPLHTHYCNAPSLLSCRSDFPRSSSTTASKLGTARHARDLRARSPTKTTRSCWEAAPPHPAGTPRPRAAAGGVRLAGGLAPPLRTPSLEARRQLPRPPGSSGAAGGRAPPRARPWGASPRGAPGTPGTPRTGSQRPAPPGRRKSAFLAPNPLPTPALPPSPHRRDPPVRGEAAARAPSAGARGRLASRARLPPPRLTWCRPAAAGHVRGAREGDGRREGGRESVRRPVPVPAASCHGPAATRGAAPPARRSQFRGRSAIGSTACPPRAGGRKGVVSALGYPARQLRPGSGAALPHRSHPLKHRRSIQPPARSRRERRLRGDPGREPPFRTGRGGSPGPGVGGVGACSGHRCV